MQNTILDINTILRNHDIEGLIEAGAPDDEYASEAEQIHAAIALLNAPEINVQNIADIISRVWSESFDLSPTDMQLRADAITQVAQTMLA